jgi:N-acyl-D-amino-acid deacylase
LQPDLNIRNGFVVDGTKTPGYPADVLLADGKIAAVGKIGHIPGVRDVDAKGYVVCPGFIDPHRHIDAALLRTREYGEVELRQGITTALCGNCGFSLFPCEKFRQQDLLHFLTPIMGDMTDLCAYESFDEYRSAVAKARPSLNVGAFVGNGTVRMGLSGYSGDPVPPEQLYASCRLIEKALSQGAFGLSMGLMYSPENFYCREELIQLAKALVPYGAPLVTHIRGEGTGLARSVREVLEIALMAKVPLQISHFKAAGKASWGEVFQTAVALTEEAVKLGQNVSCDAYPYEAGSTSLLTLLPPKWLADGTQALAEKLKTKESREELADILQNEQPDWDNIVASCGLQSIWISSVNKPENKRFVGKSIAESAQRKGVSPAELLCDLIVSEQGGAGIINFIISEDNLRKVLAWDPIHIISDSVLPPGKPHPRYYGAFPKVLRKYVREEKLLALEDAVHRMTGKTAARYGLAGKGLLKPGMDGDIVIFDPDAITDTATYENSEQLAKGIRMVVLNGIPVAEDDQIIQKGQGKALLRTGK